MGTGQVKARTWGATEVRFFSCARPFSFFRLVESIAQQAPAAEWVLHRVANLLRKHEQTYASCNLTCRLEWRRDGLPGFETENGQLTHVTGRTIRSEGLLLSFFGEPVDEKTLLHTAEESLLVHCVVKRNLGVPKPTGNVHEAYVRPRLLPNNFLNGIREYSIEVGGRTFKMESVFFCQQNGVAAKCAQSAMAMVLRAMNLQLPGGVEALPEEINNCIPTAVGRGLTLEEMGRLLQHVGISPLVVDFRKPQAMGLDYRSIVHAGIESGVPVLLCFVTRDRETGKLERHVVAVFGHTFNSDAWLAEAEFGYGVDAPHKYHGSYHWCTHWIISDDNLGMFYCLQGNRLASVWDKWTLHPPANRMRRLCDWLLQLPRRAYAAKEQREFDVVGVVVPLAASSGVDIRSAEIKVLAHLRPFADELRSLMPSGTFTQAWWIDRLVRRLSADHPGPGPILRTRQLDRQTYLSHLRGDDGVDWDGRRIHDHVMSTLEVRLPKTFWMTEYTLVDLLTANRRKLGEVLWEPQWSMASDTTTGLVLTRFPGLVKLHSSGMTFPTNCWSHVAMLSTARQGEQY